MSRSLKLLFYLIVIIAGASASAWAEGGPWVSYRLDPDSPWSVEIDAAKGLITCWHAEHADDLFEVDYDDTAADGQFPGIRPVVNGVSMSGLFFYAQAGFLSPSFYGNASAASVETDGDVLHVLLEGDDYRDLNPAAGDDPLSMSVAITYKDDGIHMDLWGLYYILPSAADTTYTMVTEGQPLDGHVTPDSEIGYTYYPNVTRVDVQDSLFGNFYFTTFCRWLQIQVHDVWELFEFDFDHSFKDYGQHDVLTKLVIPYAQTEATE